MTDPIDDELLVRDGLDAAGQEALSRLLESLREERERYREALEQIVAEQPEVSIDGDCAYCNARPVARTALQASSPKQAARVGIYANGVNGLDAVAKDSDIPEKWEA